MNKQIQLSMWDDGVSIYRGEDALENIYSLIRMHKAGLLGGERMPEDERPDNIEIGSSADYVFLTLPMALNYQRNSYKLWEAASISYNDKSTTDIFDPKAVLSMGFEELQKKLLKHKVALQPVKHTQTWFKICESLVSLCDGDVKSLFSKNDYDVSLLKKYVQVDNKKKFPYLSGNKIFNYWLFVIENYTKTPLKNRREITIAPDTHIIKSSIKLGVVNKTFDYLSANRTFVSLAWEKILTNTDIHPIDIHTPLWLWSRKNFPKIIPYNELPITKDEE